MYQACAQHLHIKFLISLHGILFLQLFLVNYKKAQTVRTEQARIAFNQKKESEFKYLEQAMRVLYTAPPEEMADAWKKVGPLRILCQDRKIFLKKLLSKLRMGGVIYFVKEQCYIDSEYTG